MALITHYPKQSLQRKVSFMDSKKIKFPKSIRQQLIEHLSEHKDMLFMPMEVIKIIAEYTYSEYEKRYYSLLGEYNTCITDFKNIWHLQKGYLYRNEIRYIDQRLEPCYMYSMDNLLFLRHVNHIFIIDTVKNKIKEFNMGFLIMGMAIVNDRILLEIEKQILEYKYIDNDLFIISERPVDKKHLIGSYLDNIMYSYTKEEKHIIETTDDIRIFKQQYISCGFNGYSCDSVVFSTSYTKSQVPHFINEFYTLDMFTYEKKQILKEAFEEHCVRL
jgi:hypothetical protein